MTKKQRAAAAVQALAERYPQAVCSLDASEPWQLLIATRLSAQCTDRRVNIVTRELFERYRSVDELAAAPIEQVERIIRPCGLYKTKARDIVGICCALRDNYGGALPDSLERLTELPGVGRKTANLIMGDVFGQPAVVTDTHLIRISNRLGLVDSTDPYRVEQQLIPLLPPEQSSDFCHRIVMFGREVCRARSPQCDECELRELCRYYQKER